MTYGGRMDELQFEWDEDKATQNLAKHGVSFLTAAEIFASEIIERIDDREDYGELRFIALGRVETEIYRVAYTSAVLKVGSWSRFTGCLWPL